jgi:ketosteroid isomerase-like protein
MAAVPDGPAPLPAQEQTLEVADAGPAAKTDDAALILKTLERYAKAVNERDLPGLLAVYDPQANVKATIGGNKRFYPLADYARALPVKFKEWEAASARIQAFEVVRLRVSGDTAEVVVKAKGSRYFLSGTLEGRATLVKSQQDWKILKDDL